MTYEILRPVEWAAKMLPPHDIEVFDHSGAVIARWDGEVLDEIGIRDRVEFYAAEIVAHLNDDTPNTRRYPNCQTCRSIPEHMTSHGWQVVKADERGIAR